MRGKVVSFLRCDEHVGITPACAGKSGPVSCGARPSWDHPRMCGEKSSSAASSKDWSGSPPHVRGKVEKSKIMELRKGITPACAGKSAAPETLRPRSEDHPRMCGEKPFKKMRAVKELGSPPHVRGKDADRGLRLHAGRITPACAGKRQRGSGSGCTGWDHPRMCGEKSMIVPHTLTRLGSPPLVRGKVRPAFVADANAMDHPRMCGEKLPGSLLLSRIPGSPPHVRGKAGRGQHHRPEPGITPACAGKSGLRLWHTERNGDHPRVCGEKPASASVKAVPVGSPPRMRGKVFLHGQAGLSQRITPAYAGKRHYVFRLFSSGRDHPRVCGEKWFL